MTTFSSNIYTSILIVLSLQHTVHPYQVHNAVTGGLADNASVSAKQAYIQPRPANRPSLLLQQRDGPVAVSLRPVQHFPHLSHFLLLCTAFYISPMQTSRLN